MAGSVASAQQLYSSPAWVNWMRTRPAMVSAPRFIVAALVAFTGIANTVPSSSSAARPSGAATANTAKAMTLRSLTGTPWADYTALRAAITDGTVRMFAVRISQNDADNADADHGTSTYPNVSGFSNTRIDVFPGWELAVDPVRFRIQWTSRGFTLTTDTAITDRDPQLSVRLAVWA